ncbi:hypothetical protein [Saccharibacillus sp. JS10]|uniref:hypothetical protein n=1 Tax=Saccharibacillus sp. JS10 TaxID=2950552 RepID=UPI0021095E14|nr:hypothetical protein [Saccharibacillus sp. JS10]MCQ4086669.1 hypothetical protein [Saccharibacillus sp. JS10]
MNRFKEPDHDRKQAQSSEEKPTWYNLLSQEPRQISQEPTFEQMRKIKEESNMNHTYAAGKRKSKWTWGTVVAAGIVSISIWGASSAGLMNSINPSGAPVTGSVQTDPGAGGMNAGGIAGGQDQEQGLSEEIAQAKQMAESFKKEDWTVTQEKLDVYNREMNAGEDAGDGFINWVEKRQKELLAYAEPEFLSVYFTNEAGNTPYNAAINTESEIAVENMQMKMRSVSEDEKQITFDYTLDLTFSNGRDPLALKGAIQMQKDGESWKVLKDTPQKASYVELYKLARPDLGWGEGNQ